MTTDELERIYSEAFGIVRQNADPAVWPIIDFLQRSLELVASQAETARVQASLLDDMLGTRLAVLGREDD